MVKPKLKERLELLQAKESLKQQENKNSSQKQKKPAKKGEHQKTEIETDVVTVNEGLAADAAAAAEKKQALQSKKEEEKLAKKETKKEELLAKRQARKEKKLKQKELKKGGAAKSKTEDGDEENDDGKPRIKVASLEDEFQRDFAEVVAIDHENDEEEGKNEKEEENEEEEEEEEGLNYDALTKSDNEEDEDEDDDEDDEDEDEEKEEEDVPYSDVEFDSDADIVPHTKVIINKVAALQDSLNRIKLPWDATAFTEHQSVTSTEPIEKQITDIYDDTERELAFYKQGLEAAKVGRAQVLALRVPFSRPADYFAEMVKSDEHMDKIKNKLVKEATADKKVQEAKKQRLLKKFGKKVQVATLQERQKQKKETLDKIKEFRSKKRRNGGEGMGDDEFDIAIEESNAAKDEFMGSRNKKRKNGGSGNDTRGSSKKAKRPGKSKRAGNGRRR